MSLWEYVTAHGLDPNDTDTADAVRAAMDCRKTAVDQWYAAKRRTAAAQFDEKCAYNDMVRAGRELVELIAKLTGAAS